MAFLHVSYIVRTVSPQERVSISASQSHGHRSHLFQPLIDREREPSSYRVVMAALLVVLPSIARLSTLRSSHHLAILQR
jgi:hypothetical protein